ncbi:MAG: TonB-dependent receptor, partial [Tidjanibacter sp.]|nr:TonB-dependent receptor [Tidjanibacter sp.]
MKKGSLIEVARLLMVALTVCAASVELSAQNNPQEGTLDTLIGIDNVVVTATKVSVNRNTVASSVSVVSRDKIENSSESALLPVLSHRIPGLFVTERG